MKARFSQKKLCLVIKFFTEGNIHFLLYCLKSHGCLLYAEIPWFSTRADVVLSACSCVVVFHTVQTKVRRFCYGEIFLQAKRSQMTFVSLSKAKRYILFCFFRFKLFAWNENEKRRPFSLCFASVILIFTSHFPVSLLIEKIAKIFVTNISVWLLS